MDHLCRRSRIVATGSLAKEADKCGAEDLHACCHGARVRTSRRTNCARPRSSDFRRHMQHFACVRRAPCEQSCRYKNSLCEHFPRHHTTLTTPRPLSFPPSAVSSTSSNLYKVDSLSRRRTEPSEGWPRDAVAQSPPPTLARAVPSVVSLAPARRAAAPCQRSAPRRLRVLHLPRAASSPGNAQLRPLVLQALPGHVRRDAVGAVVPVRAHLCALVPDAVRGCLLRAPP